MPLPDPDRSGSHHQDDAARLLPLSFFFFLFAYQVISSRFSFFCGPSDENWVLSLNDVLQIATLM